MRIFLTGGTGFIGSHFLQKALGVPHEIRALRRIGSKPHINLLHEPEWINGNLDSVTITDLQGCDVLVHLASAGVNGGTSWEEAFTVNVKQSLDLWQKAVKAEISHFVICGSCFEYGQAGERYEFIPVDAPLEPTGPYHASKAAASMAARGMAVEHKLSLIILRPFHVFGDGEKKDRFWPSLRTAALSGRDFPMSLGQQVRDFIEVKEVADTFLESATHPIAPGRPLIKNIGTGRPQSLRGFAEKWWKHWNAKGRLLTGALNYRENEVMRYVPHID